METKFKAGDKVIDWRGRVLTVVMCTQSQVIVEETLDRYHPAKLRKA